MPLVENIHTTDAPQFADAQGGSRVAARASGMVRALRHRNYRLFISGAFLSNIGTWMQGVAQGLLMYKLTNSSFWLGLDGFMATAPGLLFTLAAGVFADFIDRRRLLLLTQFGAGLSALALALLVTGNVVKPWIILVLTFFTGSCMALAGPSYQALNVELVGRRDLANAIALNSTQFQLSRVVGPFLAGLVINLFGLALCFYINAASYIAVLIGLALVKFNAAGKEPVNEKEKRSFGDFVQDLKKGFAYVRRRRRIFLFLIVAASTSMLGAPYLTMMPVYARDIFQIGDSGFALMMGVAGGGSVFGALLVTFLGDFRRKGIVVFAGAFLFVTLLMIFSVSTNLHRSMFALFGMGFALVLEFALINTVLQTLVSDEMRGRVMSMFILSFLGAMPIGNLIAGAASHRFGVPQTLCVMGAILFVLLAVIATTNKRLWAEV